MKKLLIALGMILFLVSPLFAADPADLTKTTTPASDDLLIIMDTSDTTQSADGSVNSITVDNFLDLTVLPNTILTSPLPIKDLSDVSDNISPSDQDGLVYNNTSGEWEAGVISATDTEEDYVLDWAINDNSAGKVPTDTYPGRPHETNATIDVLHAESQAAVTLDVTFYYHNGTSIGVVSLNSATSNSTDITNIDVTKGDVHYIETSANATTEWLNAYEEGVTR
jgi:hypothetical protein